MSVNRDFLHKKIYNNDEKSNLKTFFFIGSKEYGLEIFKCFYKNTPSISWVILHPNDYKDSRTAIKKFVTLKKTFKIDFYKINDISDLDTLIDKYEPDLAILCGFYKIIPNHILKKIKNGIWGFHNSILPKYRGGAPLVWQIINGEKRCGSSFFRISKGIDNGEIIHQISCPIYKSSTISTVTEALKKKWVRCIPQLCAKLLQKKIKTKKQNETDATFFKNRTPKDGLISWLWTNKYIDRFIRAQSYPYPGAFFKLNDSDFYIKKFNICKKKVADKPGTIILRTKSLLKISCGENTALNIFRIETKSGKEIPFSKFKKTRNLSII